MRHNDPRDMRFEVSIVAHVICGDFQPFVVALTITVSPKLNSKHRLRIYTSTTYSYRMSSRRESEFARLKQLPRKSDERVEQERKRAEEAEARVRIEEEKTKPTTFEEYLRACHTHLSKPLHIQTDRSLSTQGSVTSPKNKPCLTLLKPWTDFLISATTALRRCQRIYPS